MIKNAESQTKKKLYQRLVKTFSTVLHPFIRRRKKEKKKSSSKPAAEGEEQEDVEICLGSGKDDILLPRGCISICIAEILMPMSIASIF
jgi:hypothetical protein